MMDRDSPLLEATAVPVACPQADHFMFDAIGGRRRQPVENRLRAPELEAADDVEDTQSLRHSSAALAQGRSVRNVNAMRANAKLQRATGREGH